MQSPNPGPGNNYLESIAVVAANDIWAVGWFGPGATPQTLILHYDGGGWFRVASVDVDPSGNALYGVNAVSANDVWRWAERRAADLTALPNTGTDTSGQRLIVQTTVTLIYCTQSGRRGAAMSGRRARRDTTGTWNRSSHAGTEMPGQSLPR